MPQMRLHIIDLPLFEVVSIVGKCCTIRFTEVSGVLPRNYDLRVGDCFQMGNLTLQAPILTEEEAQATQTGVDAQKLVDSIVALTKRLRP
jgi:hypothetical protein